MLTKTRSIAELVSAAKETARALTLPHMISSTLPREVQGDLFKIVDGYAWGNIVRKREC